MRMRKNNKSIETKRDHEGFLRSTLLLNLLIVFHWVSQCWSSLLLWVYGNKTRGRSDILASSISLHKCNNNSRIIISCYVTGILGIFLTLNVTEGLTKGRLGYLQPNDHLQYKKTVNLMLNLHSYLHPWKLLLRVNTSWETHGSFIEWQVLVNQWWRCYNESSANPNSITTPCVPVTDVETVKSSGLQ